MSGFRKDKSVVTILAEMFFKWDNRNKQLFLRHAGLLYEASSALQEERSFDHSRSLLPEELLQIFAGAIKNGSLTHEHMPTALQTAEYVAFLEDPAVIQFIQNNLDRTPLNMMLFNQYMDSSHHSPSIARLSSFSDF